MPTDYQKPDYRGIAENLTRILRQIHNKNLITLDDHTKRQIKEVWGSVEPNDNEIGWALRETIRKEKFSA